jgi:hypothetical protein
MHDPTLLMLIISGLSSFFFGIALFRNLIIRNARTKSAIGIIIKVNLGFSIMAQNNIGFNPLVEFTDEYGVPHQFKSWAGTFPSSYHEGDKATVFYNPNNPSDAEIGSGGESFYRKTMIPIYLLLGTVFSILSFLCILSVSLLFYFVRT